MEKTPTYVSLIMRDEVHLEASTPTLRAAIAAKGHPVRGWFGTRTIAFDPEPEDVASNASLIALLRDLAEVGVAFLEDYKQGMPPDAVMMLLAERGLVPPHFQTCTFDGTRWRVRAAAVPGAK